MGLTPSGIPFRAASADLPVQAQWNNNNEPALFISPFGKLGHEPII
jgi:hypothetical protein